MLVKAGPLRRLLVSERKPTTQRINEGLLEGAAVEAAAVESRNVGIDDDDVVFPGSSPAAIA